MLSKKGFTLVELMVVILIVAILAAVAIPIMRGRIDSAKWTEGKAMVGTIATSIRAYVAEYNQTLVAADKSTLSYAMLGLIASDFQGTYFTPFLFDWSASYSQTDQVLTFSVTANKPPEIYAPTSWTLDQTGKWAPGSAPGGP